MKRKTTRAPDDEIKRLRAKIGELRRDLIDMVPWKFRQLMTLWVDPETQFNLALWERDLIAKILENTTVDRAANPYFRDRAPCPLCGDTPDADRRGFAFPVGLERHLEGFGTIRQCPVMRAAGEYLIALDSEKHPERYGPYVL